MFKKITQIVIIVLVIVAVLFFGVPKGESQTCKSSDECNKLIQEYEQKLTGIRAQKNSLASQIEFANTQIYLTTLRVQETENKIAQTEREIENLGARIEGLNSSLDSMTRILINKIVEGYKKREDVYFLHIVLDPDNAANLTNRLKYIKTSQENDSRIAFRLQQAKLNFEQQKDLREVKKEELDQLTVTLAQQKADLDAQKAQKERLLADTQNDERKYQQLLAQAKAEYAAIQGIVSGQGTESVMREVKKGDTIATLISGASCNSSGTHLHFIVQEGGDRSLILFLN